jgi:hypothetical protein
MAETEVHQGGILKLIMEHNVQIKEMEVKLEKLVKEKEKSMPMTVIPLDAVPITGISTATEATTVKIESTSVKTTDASEKLAKSMEAMAL